MECKQVIFFSATQWGRGRNLHAPLGPRQLKGWLSSSPVRRAPYGSKTLSAGSTAVKSIGQEIDSIRGDIRNLQIGRGYRVGGAEIPTHDITQQCLSCIISSDQNPRWALLVSDYLILVNMAFQGCRCSNASLVTCQTAPETRALDLPCLCRPNSTSTLALLRSCF